MAFCSSTKFPTTLLKFRMACSTGEEVGGCCVVLLGEHMLEVEVSRRGLGGSSSWGYRCCHMERLLVAYFDPPCLSTLASNPSLREQLDNALLRDQWIGN